MLDPGLPGGKSHLLAARMAVMNVLPRAEYLPGCEQAGPTLRSFLPPRPGARTRAWAESRLGSSRASL